MILPHPPLLLITDRAAARAPMPQVVAAALGAGCRWVMVREKGESQGKVRPSRSAHSRESGDPEPPDSERGAGIPAFAGMSGVEGDEPVAAQRLALATEVVALARPYGARVLVNGDVAAAKAAGANGIHLPQGHSVAKARAALGPDSLIGVSAHDEAEALAAERAGADYVTLSPIFESVSKPGYGPGAGLPGLTQIARRLVIPVVALGGIEPQNARACLDAGAGAIAVLGTIMAAPDPAAATRRLIASL